MTAPDHSSPVRSLGLLVIGAVLGGMAGFYAASAGITLMAVTMQRITANTRVNTGANTGAMIMTTWLRSAAIMPA